MNINIYPKISIITVCYNSAMFIEQAITSVKKQTYSNIEYIVIDGGSTDGTLGIIHMNRDCITKWISEPDRGIYDAMNKGIDLATGDYIAFLNSDDWYNCDAINDIANKIREEKASVFCFEANCVGVNTSRPFRGKQSFDNIRFRMIHCHQAVFAERFLFQKYGKFDIAYKIAADYEWLLRMYDQGVQIKYDNLVVVNFRAGGISSTHMLESLQEAYQIATKNANTLKLHKKIREEEYVTLIKKIDSVYQEREWFQIFREAMKDGNLLKNNNLLCMLRKTFPEKKYSIFGGGFIGEECVELLEKLDILVECVWDNKQSKWGSYFSGYEVRSPEKIKKGGTPVLVCTSRYQDEIDKQLEAKGLEEGIDFWNYYSICLKIGKNIKEYMTGYH